MPIKKTTVYCKRPTKIKVLNQMYKIEWVASSDNHGACDPDKGIIQLTKGYAPKITATTLLHELIHAIHFAMGVTDTTTEEETTQRLETGLSTVWGDNPQVFEWFHKHFTR